MSPGGRGGGNQPPQKPGETPRQKANPQAAANNCCLSKMHKNSLCIQKPLPVQAIGPFRERDSSQGLHLPAIAPFPSPPKSVLSRITLSSTSVTASKGAFRSWNSSAATVSHSHDAAAHAERVDHFPMPNNMQLLEGRGISSSSSSSSSRDDYHDIMHLPLTPTPPLHPSSDSNSSCCTPPSTPPTARRIAAECRPPPRPRRLNSSACAQDADDETCQCEAESVKLCVALPIARPRPRLHIHSQLL